ncbi:hypothetical protein BX666DRAFT_2029639 [Dichotomocladium elegans]|nr:hypothetical protein BX666DRAFT_2029639 [Dichotomocladium elegans]
MSRPPDSQQLPLEVVSITASFSTFRDHRDALFVNHAWNRAFSRVFHSHVKIETRRKLRMFFRTLRSTADRDRPLGPMVKEFILGNGIGLSNSELEALPILLPNLEVLDFKKEIWRYLTIPNTFERWTRIRKLPETMTWYRTFSLICQVGVQLTHLCLSGELLQDQDWLSVLAFTTNLEVLELTNQDDFDESPVTVSFSQLVSTLRLLRNLSSLTLRNIALLMSDHERKQASRASPFPRIRALDIRAQLDNTYWLIFFTSKFPNTENIHFDVTWRDPALSETTERDIMAVEQAILEYAASNRLLSKLVLIDISPICAYPSFEDLFRMLREAGTKPSKLSYLSFNRDTHCLDRIYFNAWAETLNENAHELEIYAWWRLKDIDEILGPTQRFKHLTNLHLICSAGDEAQEQELPIDALLKSFPNLTKLSLGCIVAMLQGDDTSADYGKSDRFKLAALEFDHVALDNAVLRYIGHSCRELKDLEISLSNKRFNPEENGRVVIDMPYQQFDRISILVFGLDPGWVSPQVHLYPMGIFSLTRLNYTHKQQARRSMNAAPDPMRKMDSDNFTRWYHLYDLHSRLHVSGINSRRIQRLRPEDGQYILNYKMDDCDWRSIGDTNNVRWVFKQKKDWKKDVFLGYTNIRCRSVKTLCLDGMPMHFWNE